ncbi:uncharacterized protein LOC124278534 [Haliotis rubra]|uniref:uncharacterized protein LOC124278534 n=1 Tax=Haliotis rubra TaxID=36100 RepID=UPI001EE5F45F|nr:uncharacterized protein LOC124278534 [Haliotis rubra]
MSCLSVFQSCHGFTGQCQQCQLGHFGDKCQHLCPSCLTAEEETFYTCRSGCKVCSSQSYPEPQQCSYHETKEDQDRQETLLASILFTVVLTLIINIAFISVVCRRSFRSKKKKKSSTIRSKRAFSDPSEMELLYKGTEQTCARCATPTPEQRDTCSDADLLVACGIGSLAEMKRILDTGWTDINCRDVFGMTPVMAVALRDREIW